MDTFRFESLPLLWQSCYHPARARHCGVSASNRESLITLESQAC
jgi:hypothetical protein